jgi:hypothetical protein
MSPEFNEAGYFFWINLSTIISIMSPEFNVPGIQEFPEFR